MHVDRTLAELHAAVDDCASLAVAVSGGVDSLTLAVAAHRRRPHDVAMFHAASAAVPPAATARVEALARAEGWRLSVVDAGEFDDPRYVANPVNRCLHCKTSLYATIARRTDRQIVSGANTDDLGDYRPGLDAARDAGVRHPFIEARIDKRQVRALAKRLGMGDLAELPSSPCLSSRVETGIPIAAPMLRGIDRIERYLREATGATTVRCRVRAGALVIELDEAALARLSSGRRVDLAAEARTLFAPDRSVPMPTFEPYRRGSAFVGDRT